MPMYEVTMTQRVMREATYVVVAEHPDDAKEKMRDWFKRDRESGIYDWDEKVYDSDTFVQEINDAAD